MEPPRSCTDIGFALPCPACNGNGGIGNRLPDHGSGGKPSAARFTDCTSCEGTGWKLKRADELTPAEVLKILNKISPPTSPAVTLTAP